MGNFHEIQHDKKRRFLNALSACGRIDKAAEAVEIDRTLHYKWLKVDPEYAVAFQEAWKMAGDMLEAEAIRRAYEGVSKPVYHRGKVVGHTQEYSDTLLIFLLKGAKPDVYKDNKLDITSGGKELRLTIGGDSDLPDGI